MPRTPVTSLGPCCWAARALDLGCGVGWSSIALAAAYPGLEVLGIDSDGASVMDARANAEAHGTADRA